MADGWARPGIGRKVVISATLLVGACGDDSISASGDASSSESSDGSTPTTSTSATESSSSDDGPAPDGSSSDDGSSSTGDPPPAMPEPVGPGISAGSARACSVADDGVLTCWGHGECGQLGDGRSLTDARVTVAGDHSWRSVAVGATHVCAIDEDAALWCWGDDVAGTLGDGSLPMDPPFEDGCRVTPVPIAEGTTWARVSVGSRHSCGVQTNGTLWCWGDNDYGQIGDGALGSLYFRTIPTEVGGDYWLDVFAGSNHTCALRSDAVVACWGDGAALGVSGLQFSSTPLEVVIDAPIRALARGGDARHTCAIDVDDRVWCWGDNSWGQLGDASALGETPSLVPSLGDVADVSLRAGTSCVQTTDGTVSCFGYGGNGQLGDGIASSQHHSPTPLVVASGSSFTSTSVGDSFACARRDDGVELCWGDNDDGQIGDGTSGPDNARLQPTPAMPWGGGPVAMGWSSVALGEHHACATREGGALWCWGSRFDGALGNGDAADDCTLAHPLSCSTTTPIASAPGTWHGVRLGDAFGCAIRDDDTLWCWGRNDAGQLADDVETSAVPLQIEDAVDWIAVDAGGATVCGIRGTGTLWCWGADLFGQLGQGVIGNDSATPLQVGSDSDWTDVAVSRYGHVCGVRAGGELSCWGRNDYGELGTGSDSEPIATPTIVDGSWSAIAVSAAGSCAVAQDGTMWCWGGLDETAAPHQIGTDSDWTTVAMAVGAACGLRTDGSAWCWGSNAYGELGNGVVDLEPTVHPPTMIANVVDWLALSGGESTFCGLRSDGLLWCWGHNSYGQQGNDTIFVSGTPREVRDDG